VGGRGFCRAKNGSEWRIATGEWFFLEGSVPTLPKNFLLFKNYTPHSAHRTDFMVRHPRRRMNSALRKKSSSTIGLSQWHEYFRTLSRANDKLAVARYNFRRPKVGA
jgi:hypothetical protein